MDTKNFRAITAVILSLAFVGCTSTKFETVDDNGYPITAKRFEMLRKSNVGEFKFNPITGDIHLTEYRNETDAKDVSEMVGVLVQGFTSAYESRINQQTREMELLTKIRGLESLVKPQPPVPSDPVSPQPVTVVGDYQDISRDESVTVDSRGWGSSFSVTFDWDVEGGKSGGLVECGKFARGPFSIFIKKPWEYCIRFGDKSRITLSDPSGIKLANPSREEDHFLYGLKIPRGRHEFTLSFDGDSAVVLINGEAKASWAVSGDWRGAQVPLTIGATPSNPHDFPHGVGLKLWGVK